MSKRRKNVRKKRGGVMLKILVLISCIVTARVVATSTGDLVPIHVFGHGIHLSALIGFVVGWVCISRMK